MRRAARQFAGLLLAGITTILGVGGGLWLTVVLYELIPGNAMSNGLIVIAWPVIGVLELALGGIGLYIGYQLYFRLCR
jgi:hypothetical protein